MRLSVSTSKSLSATLPVSRFSLHVHNIHTIFIPKYKWYLKPFCTIFNIIMQEDRCVFVGTVEDARNFYEKYDGKYCKSRFPLQTY